MASNQLGQIFRITTWGESHGPAVGVVIDGCPAGINISEAIINHELALRSPGRNEYTTPRKEGDYAQIYSGTFEGQTTGAPISIIIHNKDADSSKYEPIKNLMRPGHANYTYLEKYGVFDYRGGGRSSARETACRVAAGAVAKQLLAHYEVNICAYMKQVGTQTTPDKAPHDLQALKQATIDSPVFCPDEQATQKITQAIQQAKDEGDSLGGVIECLTSPLPVGMGDPVYEKLEANLAKAMMTMPATKGFEIGEGFRAAGMTGSEHNDAFTSEAGKTTLASNLAGGTLGGISNGQPLVMRVAFKPTSSIQKSQQTVDTQGNKQTFNLPEGSRHDPCVSIRAVPIVEAMSAIVLADSILMNRCAKID